MGYVSGMWPSMQSMAVLGGCCESAFDDEGITFLGEVRCDQHLFLQDPTPWVPRRTSTMGRPPSLLRTEARAITVSEWLKAQPASAWRRIVLRGGEKGLITIEALSARVWLWDGQEDRARRWHLFLRREIDRPDTVKFALSNAKADTSLHQLASMQAARFWINTPSEKPRTAWRWLSTKCASGTDGIITWRW